MNDVFVRGKLNAIPQPKYATLSLAASVAFGSKRVLFGDVVGTNSVGPELTNMERPFELPAPESLDLQALRLVPIGCAKADLEAFMKNTTVRLIIGQRTFLDAPPEFWPGGAGLFASTNETGGFSYSLGMPDCNNIRNLGQFAPKIDSNTNFRVEIVGTTFTTSAAFFLRVYLDGIYRYGVQ